MASIDNPLEEETRFGAYSVVLKKGSELREAIRERLALNRDDTYLEVHVPDSVMGAPSTVLGSFKDGAVKLADFLIERGLHPKCLIGVTHENVAKPARRFLNFMVVSGIPEEAVDEEKANRVEEGYRLTRRAQDGEPRGPLCFCYQSMESFMEFTKRLRDAASSGGSATVPAAG